MPEQNPHRSRRAFLGALGFGACRTALAAPPLPFRVAYDEATAPLLPLVQAVYLEIGIRPVFELLPSERGIAGANRGVYDADISRVAGQLEAYTQLMYTSEALKKTDLLPFVLRGSAIRVSGQADLRRYKVGILRGSKFAEGFARSAGLTVDLAPHPDSLLKKLELGRYEVALLTSSQWTAQSERINALAEPAGAALASSYSFHVLNKKHADLAPKFDAALRAMKADGRWARLLAPD
jgi:polar amino acid transport system substrate-binding protein